MPAVITPSAIPPFMRLPSSSSPSACTTPDNVLILLATRATPIPAVRSPRFPACVTAENAVRRRISAPTAPTPFPSAIMSISPSVATTLASFETAKAIMIRESAPLPNFFAYLLMITATPVSSPRRAVTPTSPIPICVRSIFESLVSAKERMRIVAAIAVSGATLMVSLPEATATFDSSVIAPSISPTSIVTIESAFRPFSKSRLDKTITLPASTATAMATFIRACELTMLWKEWRVSPRLSKTPFAPPMNPLMFSPRSETSSPRLPIESKTPVIERYMFWFMKTVRTFITSRMESLPVSRTTSEIPSESACHTGLKTSIKRLTICPATSATKSIAKIR